MLRSSINFIGYFIAGGFWAPRTIFSDFMELTEKIGALFGILDLPLFASRELHRKSNLGILPFRANTVPFMGSEKWATICGGNHFEEH